MAGRPAGLRTRGFPGCFVVAVPAPWGVVAGRHEDLGHAGDSRDVVVTVRAQVLADGRFTGSVGTGGGAETPFEGWLELLGLLNRVLGAGPGPPGAGPTY